MTWIIFKASVVKVWLWLKNHWQIPFLLVWTIGTYILSRRNTDALAEVLDAKKQSYEKQIGELKIRHEEEIQQRNSLIREYHNTIVKIERKYKEQEKRLTKKEKRRVKEIVKKSKGEPDVIRREIEKSFGFVYVD